MYCMYVYVLYVLCLYLCFICMYGLDFIQHTIKSLEIILERREQPGWTQYTPGHVPISFLRYLGTDRFWRTGSRHTRRGGSKHICVATNTPPVGK